MTVRKDRSADVGRVSNRDLDARLAARLAAAQRECARERAAPYVAGLLLAACVACGAALVSAGAAASGGVVGVRVANDGFSPRPVGPDAAITHPVEVVLSFASLRPEAGPAFGQAVLPISFGQPVAPEEDLPPRAHRWHDHRLRHHRRISYFLPAPGDTGSDPDPAMTDDAQCESSPAATLSEP